jgi:hypothetical protein
MQHCWKEEKNCCYIANMTNVLLTNDAYVAKLIMINDANVAINTSMDEEAWYSDIAINEQMSNKRHWFKNLKQIENHRWGISNGH